jgi:O-antigen/teichoic acid export membrane protein
MPKKFKTVLIELIYSKLVKTSALLISATILSGILGYIFQVTMGRMLGIKEYASLSALLALYSVITTPLATLMMVISRKVSEYRAEKNFNILSHFFILNIGFSGLGSIFLLLIFLGFSSEIQWYLKLDSISPIFSLAILVAITFFPSINNAFMQGLQRFNSYSLFSVINIGLKIIFSGFLVYLGYGITGAIFGIILSYLIVLAMGYYVLRDLFKKRPKNNNKKIHLNIATVFPVFIANLAFVAMTQFDVMMVNYYFNAEESGLYAAASIFGKAVMYLPGGIALAMFPMVAENHASNRGSAYLLVQAVKLTTLLCGLGAILYLLFGESIIIYLYGPSYEKAGVILKYYGIAIFPMTLVMVAEHFLIAKGRILFVYLFAAIAPLQLIAIYFYHQNLLTVVLILGISGSISVIIGYGILWKTYRGYSSFLIK